MRDEINEPFIGLTYDDIENQSDIWMNMSGLLASCHDNGDACPEYKLVHRETGAELIFDGKTKQLIASGPYKGTANIINPPAFENLSISSSPDVVVKATGHYLCDMLPAFILGVER